MFFTIINTFDETIEEKKIFIRDWAMFRVINYPMRTNEQKLSQYLMENYQTDLKSMCKKIIRNASITTEDVDKTFIVTFLNPELDKLATLITYGNEQTPGSNILRAAFTKQNY